MRNEVQLIVSVGSTTTEPTLYTGDAGLISGQTTLDLSLVLTGFPCGNPNVSIPVGSLIITDATLNPQSTVLSWDPLTCTITLDVPITWSGAIPPTCNVTLDVTTDTNTSEYLDLYEYESISQNWRFTDIQDLTSVGSFSRQFRIPNSITNSKIFGAIADSNYLPEFNYFQRKITAEIQIGRAHV